MFGENVRALRQAAGLTQRQLAEKIRGHQAMVSEIESGKRNVTLRTLRKLAKALKKTLVVELR